MLEAADSPAELVSPSCSSSVSRLRWSGRYGLRREWKVWREGRRDGVSERDASTRETRVGAMSLSADTSG